MTKIPQAMVRWWKRAPRVMGAALFLVVGLGAGAAYGYFTHTGSGSGVASTGSVQSVTVLNTTGQAVTNKLFPGSSGDLIVELTNPNTFAVTITNLTAGSGSTTATGGIGTCTTTGVAAATLSSLTISVPTGTSFVTIPSGATMSASSQTGCQGATFSVPVSLTVEKG